jgi:DNA-binding transcriptional MerR regulator
MIDTKPIYNLKVILRETGIKSDTLRAWERRYNLPLPNRTAGGHRLYSQRDLETVKWLMERQTEGLSISRAVQLWRNIEANDLDPLDVIEPPTLALIPIPGEATSLETDTELTRFRESWVQACLNFDEAGADRQLVMALAHYAPERVCLQIIQKGLSHIGELWYENKATVQQEHVASLVALRRINALLAVAPPPYRDQRVYLICPPHEEHTFPLMMLELMLRNRGWPVTNFGADVPLAQMERALQSGRPSLVVLSAQTLWTAAEALGMAYFLTANQFPVAYGGYVFNQLPKIRQIMPGYFLGETIEESVATMAGILMSRQPAPEGQSVSPVYQAALAAYERDRWLIEGRVGQILEAEGWPVLHLAMVNRHLANDIRAALSFGDVSLIDRNLAWVRQLLAHYLAPREFLEHYLSLYFQVAQEQLDEAGAPLIEWLSRASAGREAVVAGRQPSSPQL